VISVERVIFPIVITILGILLIYLGISEARENTVKENFFYFLLEIILGPFAGIGTSALITGIIFVLLGILALICA
jgi:hypothetical protein